MRSKASFRAYGAFFFDIAGRWAEQPTLWVTGAYLSLVGIVAALVAAVPGFIDYFGTVPPRSSGKRRATKHMLVNLGAVVLFGLAWMVRATRTHYPAFLCW